MSFSACLWWLYPADAPKKCDEQPQLFSRPTVLC